MSGMCEFFSKISPREVFHDPPPQPTQNPTHWVLERTFLRLPHSQVTATDLQVAQHHHNPTHTMRYFASSMYAVAILAPKRVRCE